MTDGDLLAPFAADVLARVTGRHDIDRPDLEALLAAHQRQARENPGVENLVYEWRTQFPGQPLLRRTTDAYYLRLRAHVWEEFADALDIAEADLRALLDVHEEQVRAVTDAEFDETERAMVLGRE